MRENVGNCPFENEGVYPMTVTGVLRCSTPVFMPADGGSKPPPYVGRGLGPAADEQ